MVLLPVKVRFKGIDMATKQLCVLCGINPASNGQGDHIPPKNLYTKNERMNAKYQMHTVPACIECNSEDSKYDEELKLLIGISRASLENQDDIIESLAGTIGKNSRLTRHIFKSEHIKHQYPNQVIMPKVATVFDADSCSKAILRICRAIYWKETGYILSQEAIIKVQQINSNNQSVIKNSNPEFPIRSINGDTFLYKLIVINKNINLMIMCFFNVYTVIAEIEQVTI